MLNTDKLITEYLNSKREDWAGSTQDSERHRLAAVKDLLDGKPERLWNGIQHLGKYSRLTVWSRVTAFYDWRIDHGYSKGPNPYRAFRRERATRFKNAYSRKTPDVSFEDALARISSISDPIVRAHCEFLLNTGARFSESEKVKADGSVVGKGSKERKLYFSTKPSEWAPYQQVRRALSKVGLKPHTLRKILLTELARRGADSFVLCQVAGWSTLAPAQSYITAAGAAELMKGIHGSSQKQISTVLSGESEKDS